MSNRVVYGNSWSSNGWPMVDEGSCTWVDIPGTDPTVRIEIQNGQPLQILRAFVADINAYVEHVTDSDTGCWTAGNSVSTSNHLSGTAVDISWSRHPFRIADAGWNLEQINTIREIQDFYEGTVFWGNDWTDPKDAMHFQLASLSNGGDIDTYQNPHTQDFITRKIRADGFSTFRRGDAPAPAPSEMTVPLVQNADGTWTSPSPAWAHLIRRESSGIPDIIQQIHDVNSGGNEAEGLFQITPRTWRAHNGDEFAPSPRLATPQQQAIVAARIFTRNPTGSDWGAGLPGREDAGQLAAGLVPMTTSAPPVQGDDELSAEAERQISVIYEELTKKFQSRSALRPLNEGPIDTLAGFVLYSDGKGDLEAIELLASYGHPKSLARLREIASADPTRYPDRQDDALIAQAILARVTAQPASAAPIAASSPPQVVYLPALTPDPAPIPPPVPAAITNGDGDFGQVIGELYTSLHKLRLADSLPIEARAPLQALISVLTTKNGSQL